MGAEASDAPRSSRPWCCSCAMREGVGTSPLVQSGCKLCFLLSWRGISQGFLKSAQRKELVAAELFGVIPLLTWKSVPASRWAPCLELAWLCDVCAQWGFGLRTSVYTQPRPWPSLTGRDGFSSRSHSMAKTAHTSACPGGLPHSFLQNSSNSFRGFVEEGTSHRRCGGVRGYLPSLLDALCDSAFGCDQRESEDPGLDFSRGSVWQLLKWAKST